MGDIAGIMADADMYIKDPDSRNIVNYGLSAAGLIPFVPALSTAKKAVKAAKVADDLPMDEASRMARAKEMGFDVDETFYHGTSMDGYVESTDIEKFDTSKHGDRFSADDSGFFFTNDKGEANYYASSDRDYYNKGEGEGAVYPTLLKNKNPLVVDAQFLKSEGMAPIGEVDDTVNFWDNYQGLIKGWAEDGGYDSVILKDEVTGRKMNIIFDPKNIRSINAKFDPKMKDSANLLAGGAAATVGTAAYLNKDEEIEQ